MPGVQLQSFLTSRQDGVNGQFQATSYFTHSRRAPGTHWWDSADLDALGTIKISRFCRESNYNSYAVQAVAYSRCGLHSPVSAKTKLNSKIPLLRLQVSGGNVRHTMSKNIKHIKQKYILPGRATFEVLIALALNIAVFWDLLACDWADGY